MSRTREFIDTIQEYERTGSLSSKIVVSFEYMDILLSAEVEPGWASGAIEEIQVELDKYVGSLNTSSLRHSMIRDCELIATTYYYDLNLNKYPIVMEYISHDSVMIGFELCLGDVINLINSPIVSANLDRILAREAECGASINNKKEKRNYTNSDFSLFGSII